MSHIAFSGGIAIWALKEGQYEYKNFTGTEVGLQAAIDFLGGNPGDVFVGPGTLTHAGVFSWHGGCRIHGSGRGVTTIKRTTWTGVGAANSGDTFLVTKYGQNGTIVASSADAQVGMSLEDITLDGNQAAFTYVAPGTIGHFGVMARWAKNVLIRNVEVKNYLMTGIQFNYSSNVRILDTHVHETGQDPNPSSRNGINFICSGYTRVDPYGSNCVIAHCLLENFNDCAVNFSGVKYCTFADSNVYGALTITVEMESLATNAPTAEHIRIHNITSIAGGYAFCQVPAQDGVTISYLTITDCTYIPLADGSTRARAASLLGLSTTSSGTGYIKHVNVANCRIAWPTLDAAYNGTIAVSMLGNLSDINLTDVWIENVPGQALSLGSALNTYTATDVNIIRLTVNQTNSYAITMTVGGSVNASLKRVRLQGCKIIDPCINAIGADAAIQIVANNSAVGILQDITVEDCELYRPAGGTNCTYGIRFYVTGTSSIDLIRLINNKLNAVTAPYGQISGVPTNVTLVVHGRGTDIASAATIAIPADGDTFHLTGTTNITNGITVKCWDRGRRVKIIADSTPTISDTGTSQLAGDFVGAAGKSLCLSCDGTNWNEDSRSTN